MTNLNILILEKINSNDKHGNLKHSTRLIKTHQLKIFCRFIANASIGKCNQNVPIAFDNTNRNFCTNCIENLKKMYVTVTCMRRVFKTC